MNIEFELPKGSTRIWDLDVPIVQQKNITHVYITSSIDEPEIYNELCHLLYTASEAETFHMYLNTPGGIIDSAFMIMDAMKNSKARIVGHLSGTVASAGTVLSLSCDDIVVADHTAWMSHNYSGGISGKGHEMKARQEFIDKSLNSSFTAIHKGFFTDDEINDLIEGKDFWMGKDEVLTRWKAKKAYRTPKTPRITAEATEDEPKKAKRGRPKKTA